MLNKILFGLLIVSVILTGVVSVRSYRSDKRQQESNRQALFAEHDARQQAAEDARVKTVGEKLYLTVQCRAGLEAYKLLPPEDQENLQKPDCSLTKIND